jgi:site-specific DNA-methyltransferase (adenine-specific)
VIHDGSEEAIAGFPSTGPATSGGVAGWQRGGYVGGSPGAQISRTGYDEPGGTAARYFYAAKASRDEREAGLDGLPLRTSGELTGRADGSAGLDSPRAGAGRTSGRRNVHPTVKPVDLMRYCVRLITPPGGLVLDPFAGSGSTGCGAVLEGFDFIGCDLSPEYAEIARARIAHWEAERGLTREEAEHRDMRGESSRGEQLALFGGRG